MLTYALMGLDHVLNNMHQFELQNPSTAVKDRDRDLDLDRDRDRDHSAGFEASTVDLNLGLVQVEEVARHHSEAEA